MEKQKKILNELAKEHGITIGQAEEVWKHFIGLISDTIQEPKKDEEGLYDLELFKTIHIDSFGKFVPHQRNILNANKWIKKKRDDKNKNN